MAHTWSSGRSHRARTAPRRRTLRLEQLEARRVLATWNWTGGSAVDNNWTTAANWALQSGTDLGADGVPDANDDLVFPSGAGRLTNVNNFPIDTSFNSITVNAINYNISGARVVLNNTLGATFAAGTSTLSLPINSDGDGIAVSKAGAGTLALSGVNGYSGTTTIGGGDLQANNSSALGTSSVTVNAVADANLFLGNGVNVANPLEIKGGSVAGFGVLHTTGTATYSGPINITGSANAGGHFGGGTLTITNTITSSVNVTFRVGTILIGNHGHSFASATIGQGTLRLTASNALPVGSTLNVAASAAGTLDLNGFNQTLAGLTLGTSGAATITTGAGTLTLNGNLSSTGNVTHIISGNLNLGGGTRTFTVADGTQAIDVNLNNLNLTNGTLTKAGPGTLQYGGGGTFALNLTAINVNTGVFTYSGGGATYTVGGGTGKTTVASGATFNAGTAASINTDLDIAAGGTANLTNATSFVGSLSGAGNLVLGVGPGPATPVFTVGSNNLSTTFNGIISQAAGNVAALTKVGTGTLTLGGTNANTYTGLTTVSAGAISLNKSSGVNAFGGDATVSGGSITWAQTNQVPDTSSILVTAGLINTNNRAETLTNVTINSGVLSVISALDITGLLTITAGAHDLNSGATTTANQVLLSGNANIRLGANSGPSVLNIGAGGLTMNGASIQFGQLGNPAQVATVNLNGNFTGTGTNLFDLQNAQAVLNLGAATRTFDVSSGTTTIETVITSTGGGLTKTGAGTLAITGTAANTLTGPVTVNAGLLTLNKTAGVDAIGAGGLVIENNTASTTAEVRLLASNQINNAATVFINANASFAPAILNLNNFSDTVGATTMRSITGDAAQINTGTGTLTLNGDLVMQNDRAAAGNTGNEVRITGNLDLGGVVRNVTVTTSVVQANTDATISAAISNGTLNKLGDRDLILAGTAANTQATTIVNAGGLQLNKTAGVNAVGDTLSTTGTGYVIWQQDNQVPDTATINFGSSGTSTFNSRNETFVTLNVSAGVVNNGSTGGTVNVTGLTTVNGGALNVNSGSTLMSLNQLTYTGGSVAIGGDGAILEIGAGGLSMTAETLDINSGTVGGTVRLNGDVTVVGSATISVLNDNGTTPTIGRIDLNGGTRTFTINDGTANPDLRIEVPITNGALTKAGAGTLTLEGLSTYTGATTINAGVLEVASLATNGSNSPLGAGTSLIFGGGVLRYTGASTTFNRSITLNTAGNHKLDVSTTATNLTHTGSLTGSGRLTKVGPGTLTFNSGASSFGGLDAAGGNLVIAGSTNFTLSSSMRVGVSPGSLNSSVVTDGTQPGAGTLTVQDSASLRTTSLQLGENSDTGPGANLSSMTPVVNQTGGTITTTTISGDNASVKVGHWPRVTGTYNLSGGSLVMQTGDLVIATSGSGSFIMTGGTASTASGFGVVVNQRPAETTGFGSFFIRGGVFTVGSGGVRTDGGTSNVELSNGGTLRAAANFTLNRPTTLGGTGASSGVIDTNGFTVTVPQVLSNGAAASDLRKIGAGTLVLNAANTFTGLTNIEAGTLAGTGSLASDLNVASSALLSPGGSPGTFTASDTVLQAGSTFVAELTASGNDRLVVNGNVDLNGAILSATNTGTPTAGQSYILIQPTGTITGTFNGLAEGAFVTVSGQLYHITYGDPLGLYGTGNTVALVRNRLPIANDDAFGPILINTALNGNVKTNDVDADNDSTVELVTGPASGTLNLNADGTFTYTPGNNFVGTVSFVYRLIDLEGPGDTATVRIDVSNIIQNGSTVTVGGLSGPDRITVYTGGLGTAIRYNNTVRSFAGITKVVVYGGAGDDTIMVSANVQAELYGQGGNDYLSGGLLNDLLDGGDDNDRIFGNSGNDVLLGGAGADSISAGLGNDYASGDDMVDTTSGTPLVLPQLAAPILVRAANTAGRDTMNGDQGNDILLGGGDVDKLTGGDGDDLIRGGAGDDTIEGGNGNDLLYGEAGVDKLYGRAGADVLIGGDHADVIYGGGDSDLILSDRISAALDDNQLLAVLLQNWASGDYQNTADDLESFALPDNFADALYGEGGADWYLYYFTRGDRIKSSAELNAPNVDNRLV